MKPALLLGSLLMMLGAVTLVAFAFRSMGRTWTFGTYELWVLPVTGVALLGAGRLILR